MKKGNQTAFKFLTMTSGLVTNLQQVFIILIFSSIMMSMFGTILNIEGVADILYNVVMVTELFLVVLYIGLTIILRKYTSIVGTGRVYQGVEVWRITSFWAYLKDTLFKDMLVWNGVLLTLLAYITKG